MWLWVALAVLLAAGAGVAAYLLTRPVQKPVTPVVGEQFDTARTQLQDAGFKVSGLSEISGHPVGYVFAENPPGETKADVGSTVTLTYSAGPQNTYVPAVQGEPLAQAKRAIRNAHLTVGATQYQHSGQYSSGDVLSTAPSAGQSVPAGTTLVIVVSSGRPPVSVPNVVGQSQADATSALQAAGLSVTSTTQTTSSTQAGNVVSETPKAGFQVAPGSTVSIVVAKAPKKKKQTPPMATVPDVRGDTTVAATSALSAAGLNVNQTTRNVTSKAKNGVVLSQSPGSGASVTKGSTVTIVIGQHQQSRGGSSTAGTGTATTGTSTTGTSTTDTTTTAP